ncbi:LysR family transcriptional regulator [Jannaschia sp. W003]|uniref:LysR family transcriptional regulator n=1 Tax=Jannaschia sp. W003 TaxID=2867012 RepID=UPI0021A5FD7D|nr:LysR family transcriptional regulator [Jannaschia sp. W003]UWQ20777.1 LysR family transcriptional regulator [Jannaschia sp. W003]
MEMAQVRYALAAAERLNFTRAAEACGVTQPALTKGVKALETELGALLFLREHKRVTLTAFGERMLPCLQQIREGAEAVRAAARAHRLLERVPLRVGVLDTVGHVRLARFLARLEREHPALELGVETGMADALADRLEAGAIDVAITGAAEPAAGAAPRFEALPLYAERYVVVLPPGHRLLGEGAVPLAALDGEPYVDRLGCEMREMVMAACEGAGVALYARFRSEREDWVQAMVLAGIGFAFMPEYSVTLPGLAQRPLVEPEVSRRIVVATAPGRRHPPAVAALLGAARRFAWPG